MIKVNVKRVRNNLKSFGFNLLALSVLTGIFAGIVVTFYNICADFGGDCARKLYALIYANPAFIPLLFIGLAAGALVIGTLVRFVPMIRGSGIPQIEGAARGKFGFKWYTVMCSMFAASLACMFLGLTAGGEGPSIEIGGCAGEAAGVALRRSHMVRRMQIAAGASAGFAVAFNAPVTGMIFALEESFRSFAPQVFICSAVSVISALLVRTGIVTGMNAAGVPCLSLGFAFGDFVFVDMGLKQYGFLALACVITALCAVGFYYAAFALKRAFKRVTFLKGAGKFIIPFVLAGAFGLITLGAIGSGHSFIENLATGGGEHSMTVSGVFGLPLVWALVIIVLLRFIATTVNMSCGVPCGVFIPMLAIGAGLGAILSVIFGYAGFDAANADYLIIICMAVFFTTFVRAPITGICLIFELTGQFRNFLPALVGIVIAYVVSELCRLQPGYERSLAEFMVEEGFKANAEKVRVNCAVQPLSEADGGKVRTIIWPSDGLVVNIVHTDGSSVVPDGETILTAGDTFTFECETTDKDELMKYLYDIAGTPKVEE